MKLDKLIDLLFAFASICLVMDYHNWWLGIIVAPLYFCWRPITSFFAPLPKEDIQP